MVKALSYGGIALAVVIVAILVIAATRPDSFRIQRAVTINTPPDKIFALINDFRSWSAWSPWENKDPAMKRSFSGAPAGVGAIYGWEGDSKVGVGRMEIVGAAPPDKIIIKLDFIKPFEAHNMVNFTFARAGDRTNVTWSMEGPQPFMAKVMGLFFSMERMVGPDFEAGLANLKKATES